MINIGIGVSWAKAIYSVANNVIANFKARVLSYPNSIFEAEPCLHATLAELNAIGLLKDASLIITPNAYNEGILYDVVPNTTLGDMNVVRATTATRVNSAGLIEVVPRNLLTYSNDFTDASWLKSGVTITANTTIAPNGTTTASKIVEDGFLITYGVYKGITTGFRYSHSIYAKKGERDWIKVNAIHGANQSVWFNLANGTIGTNNTSGTPSIENVGNGWYRCSINNTIHNVAASFFSVMPCTNNNVETYTGTIGSGIFIWGAQLDLSATVTEYFPTTTRLNIPRIDYTNGSCPSLLVEPQRTNMQLYSNALNLWTLSNTTVTANYAISPDGTQNANRVQFTTGGLMYYGSNGSAGSNTLTVYAKAKNGVSAKFRFFANGYTLLSDDKIANGEWQKFTFTYTFSALTAGLAIATTGADDILFYGFQHEIGSYATSYIPTVASTVTRNADVISKTGISSLIGQTEGVFYVEISGFTNDLSGRVITIGNNTFSNYMHISLRNISGLARFVITANGVNIRDFSTSIIQNNINKLAIKYSQTGYSMWLNGIKVASGITACNFNLLNTFKTSEVDNSNPYFGNINSVQLYKTALTDAECIALTTL
jgi:hypothetical protein